MAGRTTLFVLIDALGWTYIENTGFLSGVMPYRQPLRTVLGYSSGAIPSILTGEPPCRTGHWNLLYYNPGGSPYRWLRPFTVLPDALLDQRITRKALKEMGRRLLGLGALFECCVSPRFLPYFDWIEKRNIYQPRGIGGAPSIFDHLEKAGVPYRSYSYHAGRDEKLLEAIRRDLEARAASFYFLYLCEVDHILHEHCTEPDRVQAVLGQYAVEIEKLFRMTLAADPEARLAVASDHGMTPVTRHHDLMSGIEKLGLRMPQDYLAVYDSTMARFWFFNDAAREAVTRQLAGEPCGRVLEPGQLRDLGIYFEDGRFGQLIFLLDPGVLLARSDFNGSGWLPKGMHGYHPDDRYSDGIFLSNRPPQRPLGSITDLFGWMREAGGNG